MRISRPARRHGIPDADIWHAVRQTMREFERGDLVMVIGPARDGALLEIGILGMGGDDPVIVHAMACRNRFYKYLGEGW